MPYATYPFLVHFLIETPAALTFILRPSSQVPNPTPSVALILQSFGGLLLSTNLTALVFFRRDFDDAARLAALAYAFWHLWPCYRAWMRIRGGIDTQGAQGRTLGGPPVHLLCHVVLLLMFLASGMCGSL